MSLLMDALKRAETARKADGGEASAHSEQDPEITRQGLSLDPIEPETAPPAEVAPEPEVESEASSSDLLSGFERDELSLEGAPGLGAAPDSAAEHAEEPPGAEALEADAFSPEDTAATLPSIKAAQASVEDYFDGTRSISMSMGAVDAAMDDDTTTGERAQVDTGSRRSARAMFEAKAIRRRRTSWAAVLLVPLVVLALLAGGGYFFWDTLVATFVGAPRIAQRPSVQPPPEPIVVKSTSTLDSGAATEQETQATAASSTASSVAAATETAETTDGGFDASAEALGGQSGAQILSAAIESPQATEEVPTSGNFSAIPTLEEVVEPVEPVEPEPPAETVAALEIPPDTTITEALADAIDAAGLRPQGSMGARGIKITRNAVPARVHPLIAEGYEAFQAGDTQAAERAYRRVLRAQPRNRDAMLGLAAIAMTEGAFEEAAQIYLALLSLDPNDGVAQAAIISLHDNVDPLASETRIKNLLREAPEAAHLYFGLGNVFARQQRWAEAQQAFFDAYRLESDNADYAYNLAVSLDRLVQTSSALDFYRVALDLADRSYASFATEAVLERIRSITPAQ